MIEETEKFKANDVCNSGVVGSYPLKSFIGRFTSGPMQV